jgi:hypothetical protein
MADTTIKIVIPDAISTRVLRAYARATNRPDQVPDPAWVPSEEVPVQPMIDNPVTRKAWMVQMLTSEIKSKVRAWEQWEHEQTSTAGAGLDGIAEG